MRQHIFSIFFASIGFMPFCLAQDPCCNKEPAEECADHRAHVQLFFSGVPEERVEDPRENYEWPGMNEDTFYDYFTK